VRFVFHGNITKQAAAAHEMKFWIKKVNEWEITGIGFMTI